MHHNPCRSDSRSRRVSQSTCGSGRTKVVPAQQQTSPCMAAAESSPRDRRRNQGVSHKAPPGCYGIAGVPACRNVPSRCLACKIYGSAVDACTALTIMQNRVTKLQRRAPHCTTRKQATSNAGRHLAHTMTKRHTKVQQWPLLDVSTAVCALLQHNTWSPHRNTRRPAHTHTQQVRTDPTSQLHS